VYEYIRTSNPLPTVASRGANSCFNSGVPEIASGRTWTRIWRSGMPEIAQRQTPTHILTIKCQVSIFRDVWQFLLATWSMNTNSGSFPRATENCGQVQNFGNNNIDLKSIAERRSSKQRRRNVPFCPLGVSTTKLKTLF